MGNCCCCCKDRRKQLYNTPNQPDSFHIQMNESIGGNTTDYDGHEFNIDCHPSELDDLEKQRWYYRKLSRIEAEEKLENQPDGTYLVRNCSHFFEIFPYVISIIHRSNPKKFSHYRIHRDEEGYLYLNEDFRSKSLLELLRYHKGRNQLNLRRKSTTENLAPLSVHIDGKEKLLERVLVQDLTNDRMSVTLRMEK